ncbi:hypothetical protein FBQ97_04565 [Acidobacteria bacterium ACD]|nr:hypothetical protein [Acidobacteria bacterium ACD]
MRRLPPAVALISMALLSGPSDGADTASGPARAALPGTLVTAPDGASPMEVVSFDREATRSLLGLGEREAIRLDGWPLLPSLRVRAVLRPLEVYAPEARILLVRDGVTSELPRSSLRFFSGVVEEGPEAGTRFVAWVDPETSGVGGLALTRRGPVLLVPPEPGEGSRSRLAAARAFRGDGYRRDWSCGAEEAAPERYAAPPGPPAASAAPPSTLAATRTAVLAIDTDAEYLDRRFFDNTTNAVNYIAQLVAGTSVIYERDAGSGVGNGVKVLQGYTIVRVGESSDPYSDTQGTVTSNDPRLSEFRTYWNANYPSSVVKRALAAMLSGRQGPRCTSSCSASGIASLGVLCGTSGYSLNLLFNGSFGLDLDLSILAHELGHNFGAPHTHNCAFSPPIDTCMAAEGGCALKGSCPAPQTINGVSGVTGTLMSYCHLRPEQDCDSFLVFHPRSISDPGSSAGILDDIQNAACLAAVPGSVPAGPAVTGVSPSTGSLSGGQSVTITGTGFASGATVAFVELPSNDVFGASLGAKSATSVVFSSSTSLTATVPSATNAGTVDVVVMNPDQQTGTLRNGFSYLAGPPSSRFHTLAAPCRAVDTRTANPPALAASSTRTFVVTGGTCGVPATAKAVSVNATAVSPAAAGFLTLYPGNGSVPGTSTLNFQAGQTRANNAVVLLASDGSGTVGVLNGSPGATHVLVDVNGYFE